jgi:hypothetical protein
LEYSNGIYEFYEHSLGMTEEKWTNIGMPRSIKDKIDERKPEGRASHIYIGDLMDRVDWLAEQLASSNPEKEQKLRNATLNTALEIDVLDDPYEAIDLFVTYLGKEFDNRTFEDDLAMEIRVQELIDGYGDAVRQSGDSGE